MLFPILIFAGVISLLLKSIAPWLSPLLLGLTASQQGVYSVMGIFLPVVALAILLARPARQSHED